jgi:hypothetical protein
MVGGGHKIGAEVPLTDRGDAAMMSSPVPERSAPRALPWQISASPVRPLDGFKRQIVDRRKAYRHQMLVTLAASGPGSQRAEWIEFAGSILECTLQYLVGPAVPLDRLVAVGLSEVALSWPPSHAEEPLSIWLQRIAAGVALDYLVAAPACANGDAPERPGGVRQLLSCVYSTLRTLKPEDQLAFALVELGGRSLAEAAEVFGVSAPVVEQRVQRARRRLLFAARRNGLLVRYLCLSARWRALAARPEPQALLPAIWGSRPTGVARAGSPPLEARP